MSCKTIATKVKVKINHFNKEKYKKKEKLKEINLEKEIELMEFYSIFFDIINTNRRKLFISVWGTQIVISFFKTISIYFTKVINIPFCK